MLSPVSREPDFSDLKVELVRAGLGRRYLVNSNENPPFSGPKT